MPGWYGTEKGQKPEMGKKWKINGKEPPAGQGQKIGPKKWAENGGKNGKRPRKSNFWPFFCPFSARGSFPFGFPMLPQSTGLLSLWPFPARTSPLRKSHSRVLGSEDERALLGVLSRLTEVVSYSPSSPTHPPTTDPPSQGVNFESVFGRFRVDVESISSRDSQSDSKSTLYVFLVPPFLPRFDRLISANLGKNRLKFDSNSAENRQNLS